MKRLIFVTLATAAIGLVSCGSDEASTQNVTTQEEIQLLVSMEGTNKHITRASHNLQIDLQADYASLGIFAYKTGETSIQNNYGYENRTVTGATDNGTNKKLELTPVMTFPLSGGGDVDVYVYAPYKNTYTDVTSMGFTVQDNQASDANYIASDFVYGKATAVYNGDKTAAVTMHHALTKLTFKIDDVGNGTNAAGISAINLLNIYKSATIDMSAALNSSAPWLTAGLNVTTNTQEAAGNIIISNLTTDPDLYDHVRPRKVGDEETIGNGVSVIIPAQNVLTTEGSPKVSVTIDGITKDAYLGSEGDEGLSELIPGYEYVYTLNIKSQNVIVVAVSISPWVQDTQSRDLDFTPTP